MLIQLSKANCDNDKTIFASEKYLQTISSDNGWIKGYEDNELIFILPFAIKHKLFFKALIFCSNTIYLKKVDVSLEKLFISETLKFLSELGIDVIQQPPSHVVFNTFPEGSQYIPFGTYQINLTPSIDELWENVHSKHRNVIRNSEKGDVKIINDSSNKRLAYDLISNTMLRSGLSFMSYSHFDRIVTSLEGNIKIFMAFKNDMPQGCAVTPFSKHSAYYMWGGSIEKPYAGSMNHLQWEIIKYFKGLGTGQYDFVGARISPEPGSRIEGIQKFKSRFGAELKSGYLWKYICNPLNYNIYRTASIIKNWKNRQAIKDIIDQELMR